MKSQVNLYAPHLQPKLRVLSLRFVFVIWFLIGLLAVLINTYVSSSQQVLETELQQLQERNQQQSLVFTTLQKELQGLVADPDLTAQVATKQQIYKLKTRTYAELVGQEKQKSTGFADLMIDLAENHQKELWLTRIYLDNQNVKIEGATEDSAVIPSWVNNLGKSSYFKGQEFAGTRIFRNSEEQLNFILTSGQDNQSSPAVTDE